MAGHDRARVLYSGGALEERFDEVAHLSERAAHDGQCQAVDEGKRGEVPEVRQKRAAYRATNRPGKAFSRLVRADGLIKLGLAEEPTREVATGVAEPCDHQREEHIGWTERALVAAQQREHRDQPTDV